MIARLDDLRLWVLGVGLLIGLIVARELGRRLHHRFAAPRTGADPVQGYVVSAIMGLLALLVAFTFSLSLSRYEARRQLVIEEANAIGTAAMRAAMLDEPHASRLHDLYLAYAEVRLAYGQAQTARQAEYLQRSADLRAQIQSEALVAYRPFRENAVAVLGVPAVNAVLDIGAARDATRAARIPTSVIAVLMVYALIAAAVLGASMSAAGIEHQVMTVLMYLLLTLAFLLILDLDRSAGGSIRVSQAPMADLVRSLRSAPPAAAAESPPSPAGPASAAAAGSSRP